MTVTGGRQEWKKGWPLVLAAAAGYSFGAIPTVTLGVFMNPLEGEFGWSRSQIAFGLTLFAIITTPLTPFAGALMDRFSPRAIAVPGLVLTGASFAAFGLTGPSITGWLAIWVGYSLFSLLIRSMIWTRSVAAAFSSKRGLAIALVLSGAAVSSMVGPIICEQLIAHFGWRAAYVAIGLGWPGVALLLVIAFFRIPGAVPAGANSDGADTSSAPLQGLSLKQASRNLPVIRIAVAILLQTLVVSAFSVHLVPLQINRGLTSTQAAAVFGFLGVASVAGSIAIGWIVDKRYSAVLPFIAFVLPALGYSLILTAGDSIATMIAAALLVGAGSGASMQLATFLTTQYAGVLHFGKIFGVISSLMGLAAGIGPFLAGVIFDRTASYDLFLIAGFIINLLAGLAVFALGPYPSFDEKP